jgi:hypothetical protein
MQLMIQLDSQLTHHIEKYYQKKKNQTIPQSLENREINSVRMRLAQPIFIITECLNLVFSFIPIKYDSYEQYYKECS